MTEDIQKFDLIILGNGICAQSILFEIAKSDRFDLDTLKIAQVSNDKVFSPCTLNSTSVLSLSGTSKGMSPLGDLIVDSYHYTKSLAKDDFKKSFYSARQTYIYDESKGLDKFLRRHGSIHKVDLLGDEVDGIIDEESFVIDNISLLNEIKLATTDLQVTQIEDTVVDIQSSNHITLQSGKVIGAKKVISALGAYSNHFIYTDEEHHLSSSKIIPGDYLKFNNIDLGKHSYIITKGHFNLVYRAFEKSVLIGGTTLKTEWVGIDYVELRPLYEYFKGIIDDLPNFEEGEIHNGLRHKGRRRMPFLGEVSDSVYSFHGVYKNGFTFSFYMANKFVNDELKL